MPHGRVSCHHDTGRQLTWQALMVLPVALTTVVLQYLRRYDTLVQCEVAGSGIMMHGGGVVLHSPN